MVSKSQPGHMVMGSKHSIQMNLPVPTTFNIANTACISLDAYIDHVLGNGIPTTTTFAYYSITGPNLVGLQGSEQCWKVVNLILANVANTSVMVGYLWSDGFLGSNIRQKDNLVWAMNVTLSQLSVHAVSKHPISCCL